MQRLDSNNQSSSLPLKAFHNELTACSILQEYNSNLATLKVFKLAFERLLKDWMRRHEDNPDFAEDLEKEKLRLLSVLEIEPLLEIHGLTIEDNLPNYYLVKVELD